jgi:hypothetical protein
MATATQTTPLPEFATQRRYNELVHRTSKRSLENSSYRSRDDVMSHSSVRRSSWLERLKSLKERWQHSLLVEYALVALLVAVTGIHLLLVFSPG